MSGETTTTTTTEPWSSTKPAGREIKNSKLFGLLNQIYSYDDLDLDSDTFCTKLNKYYAAFWIAHNLKSLSYRGIHFNVQKENEKDKDNKYKDKTQRFVRPCFNPSEYSNPPDSSVVGWWNTIESTLKNKRDQKQMYRSLKTKIVVLCRDLAINFMDTEDKKDMDMLVAAHNVWLDIKKHIKPPETDIDEYYGPQSPQYSQQSQNDDGGIENDDHGPQSPQSPQYQNDDGGIENDDHGPQSPQSPQSIQESPSKSPQSIQESPSKSHHESIDEDINYEDLFKLMNRVASKHGLSWKENTQELFLIIENKAKSSSSSSSSSSSNFVRLRF